MKKQITISKSNETKKIDISLNDNTYHSLNDISIINKMFLKLR